MVYNGVAAKLLVSEFLANNDHYGHNDEALLGVDFFSVARAAACWNHRCKNVKKHFKKT